MARPSVAQLPSIDTVADLQAWLQAELLAGTSTVATRRAIAAEEHRLSDLAVAAQADAAAVRRALDDSTAAAASAMAAAVRSSLAARLADLEPPASPFPC